MVGSILEYPLLRREVAGCRQARPGQLPTSPVRAGRAGTEILSQHLFLDRNQTLYLRISSCTRYTDLQKIDVLNIGGACGVFYDEFAHLVPVQK